MDQGFAEYVDYAERRRPAPYVHTYPYPKYFFGLHIYNSVCKYISETRTFERSNQAGYNLKGPGFVSWVIHISMHVHTYIMRGVRG